VLLPCAFEVASSGHHKSSHLALFQRKSSVEIKTFPHNSFQIMDDFLRFVYIVVTKPIWQNLLAFVNLGLDFLRQHVEHANVCLSGCVSLRSEDEVVIGILRGHDAPNRRHLPRDNSPKQNNSHWPRHSCLTAM
jgi:hypothetical protein